MVSSVAMASRFVRVSRIADRALYAKSSDSSIQDLTVTKPDVPTRLSHQPASLKLTFDRIQSYLEQMHQGRLECVIASAKAILLGDRRVKPINPQA